jgi:ABC-type antimicrobial peptide transport system permease subunit
MCVNCNSELLEANDSNKGRKKFLCADEDCSIAITICNGTLLVTRTTVTDLVESARDIFSYLEESDSFTVEEVQSVSSTQKALRKKIQGEKERLVSEEHHEELQEKFEEFTEIAKELYEKEKGDGIYQSPEGEEVVDINGVYNELANVLLYTVLIYPEQDEGDIYQKPIESDDYYEEFEVEPYKVELESTFREAGLLEE